MERACDYCGQTYTAKRSTSRFCSDSHRALASQKGGAKPRNVVKMPAPPVESGALHAATLAELESAGAVDSSAGQRALALAKLIDSPPPMTYSSVAAWSREHGAAMTQAMARAKVAASTLDELKARRRAKRGA